MISLQRPATCGPPSSAVSRRLAPSPAVDAMTRHHLVPGHIIPVYTAYPGTSTWGASWPIRKNPDGKRDWYRRYGLEFPPNYAIARLTAGTRIGVCYFDVDEARFHISAPSLDRTYEGLRALDAALGLIKGWCPDGSRFLPRLVEVSRLPGTQWSQADLRAALREDLSDLQWSEFFEGVGMNHDQLVHLGPIIEAVAAKPRVGRAMAQLAMSRTLWYGHMAGSYYHSHYTRERQAASREELRRRYFEHRERYELAFTAGFKGIESFFGVQQIRKPEINSMLAHDPTPGITPDGTYRRWHEIFRGKRQRISHEDLINHFLKIRNVVAAHSNSSPPRRFLLTEDSVMEVQLYVTTLCRMALGDLPSRPLPPGSFIRLRSEATEDTTGQAGVRGSPSRSRGTKGLAPPSGSRVRTRGA